MHASSGKGMTHSTSDKKCRAYRNKQQALAQRELDTDEAGNAAPRGVPRDGFLHDWEGYRPIRVPRVHPGQGRPTDGEQGPAPTTIRAAKRGKQKSADQLGGESDKGNVHLWKLTSLAVPSDGPIVPVVKDDHTGRSREHTDDARPATRRTNNTSQA